MCANDLAQARIERALEDVAAAISALEVVESMLKTPLSAKATRFPQTRAVQQARAALGMSVDNLVIAESFLRARKRQLAALPQKKGVGV